MASMYETNARCSVSKGNAGCGSVQLKHAAVLPCTMAMARMENEPEGSFENRKCLGWPYWWVTSENGRHVTGEAAALYADVHLQACDGECDGVGLRSVVGVVGLRLAGDVTEVPGSALQLKLNVDDGVSHAPAHGVKCNAGMKIMRAVRAHCIRNEVAEDGADH